MRPIADAPDQPVFDRIDVTILDVAAEILIVADQMFPEPTLPDGTFAACHADRAPPLGLGNGLGKAAELMKPVVANLSEDDIIAISSYLGSLPPL